MNMTNEEYGKLAGRHQPRSRHGHNLCMAFVIGGAICCLGQLLTQLYLRAGLEQESASTACSVTLVLLSAALTALGWYDDAARVAGAGTLVPITGFANSLAAPAVEFKAEGLITGTAVKMFSIAGPVLVYGTAASVVYGLLLCLLR